MAWTHGILCRLQEIKERITGEGALRRIATGTDAEKGRFADYLCRAKANVCAVGDFEVKAVDKVPQKEEDTDDRLPNRDDL